MNSKNNDKQNIICYILGELSEEERDKFEENYFNDDEAFQELEVIESELIDDYVRESLSSQEKSRFESKFLTTIKRRERVEFARLLMKSVQQNSLATSPIITENTTKPTIEKRASWQELLTNYFLSQINLLRWSTVLALLITIIGSGWLLVANHKIEKQFINSQAENIKLQEKIKMLTQQADKEAARSKELASNLQREQKQNELLNQEIQATNQLKNTLPMILSFILDAGTERGAKTANSLKITKDAKEVELKLKFNLTEHYQSFKAVLKNADGEELWSDSALHLTVGKQSNTVNCRIDAGILQKGDYTITLTGLPGKRETEYSFLVVDP